ncbi:efflux RND transporter permease subunit [Flavobacterium johnsoniae]|jgi:HAE1 family hydrophobic/amphiphilic exporter-1/multidrug efflux pump|uniref:Hydrophobic/amphiphilic exporter-1, HAE1 family/multidrug efflux pump n=2 Tax=Flavobacterium johnsoniae TaxID=986 RepID=A0A1M5SLD0_FLAJO|nr:efflux RND transporter permease subunit [Flavobacterium johnsoniae]ABQ05961.1 acriflavin resistance protein [Flavobacterium johnsoniae UW101]OXE95475.1 acriflavin resistance protein [Flavobacterium johnsoniae UW101]WQG81699.1 efflux RND transporter permease subunit [Flavobacterium johnsoniae UW101]SHH39265.1 hydrophobic/amphiphilic exporter-1, HAE1 family/multidrug efflux pump [Flavobacterium johnsoniae]SHK61431.1 hydrophobic/amphiphilic exporter-1, HAE1 family/multidrug efflux pump [Flavob
MSLSTTSIRRPVLTIVLNLLIILFGFIGYTFLGVREFPSIDPAQVSIRTNYTGANADIIESQITEPLEKAVNAIDGIRNITSSSNQGSSNITIEFNLDKDLEEAANDVRDKVSQAIRSLPQDIDAPPVVSKADADSDAIISMTVQSDTRSSLELSDYAENVISQRLETIPGVSAVQIWGQKRYAMRLWIDPAKLSAYGCTVADVRTALNSQNVELPSGKLTGNNTELTVKTVGNLSKPEEFNNIIIRTDGDKIVRLSDIGGAELGPENLETKLSQSGLPLIGLAIVPMPGANYLDISKEFYKKYETLKKDLPKDIKLNIALDNTIFVKKSVLEVAETLGISIVLVIIIIYLFFRDWAIAFRPLIDIPVSLIATFFIMWLFGFSINVLTLLAIVLATGLVVDDGIVVTENIFKKVEEGMSPIEAAIKGSNEIFYAVISISVTLAAVFLPVIFLEGFVGRLFREFGVVIGAAVLISAFVSLTLTPMLNAYLMKGGEQKKSKFYIKTEPFFEKMNSSYAEALTKFMDRKWISFPILIACFGLIYLFFTILPKETAPYDDRSSVTMRMTTPEGSSYEYTDRFMQEISRLIDDSIPEKKVSLVITSPGFSSNSVNSGLVRLTLKDVDEREKSQKEIADKLTKWTKQYPNAKTSVTQQPTIAVNRRGGLPIQYIIQAPNFDKLREKIPVFMNEVGKSDVFSTTDVNLKFNKPEINVTIDRAKAESLGISILDIAQTLQLSLSGQRFGYFIKNGKQYQVIGQFDQKDRSKPLDLTSMFVKNKNGELIQMDNVVKVYEQSNPPQLYHNNRYMSATVSAGLAPGKSLGEGIQEMDRIKAKVLDESFTTDLAGESRDFVESSSNTSFAFGLALLLIFLILAAQFESFIDPFIIILTVPMAVAGALFSLWLFNQTWNIFSQIGTVMLIGLVTKNGILIVEFANQLREQGKPKMEAILEASEARLRPILMTSLAIALGALPIAMSLGAASTSRIGMGVVIVGGTIFSLALTLFVIPAIYFMWSKARKHYPEFDRIDEYEKESIK